MKIYRVEKEKLELFVERYESFMKTAPFVRRELSLQDKDCMSMILIDFCCICDQKGKSYWNNPLIDEFVTSHEDFYLKQRVVRDSFIAHLDHSEAKVLKINSAIHSLTLGDSNTLKEFYNLCRKILAESEVI